MNAEDFDRLVYEHQGLIWKVCRTYCANEEDQRDLFQDILVKLWKGKETFQHKSKISTWLYRISLNQAIDRSRRRRPAAEELRETADAGDRSDHDRYDIEALYLAIDKLAPLEKAMILLYLEQLPYRDIAEVIGISEKNVSVKLVRIKEKLKFFYLEINRTEATDE